MDKKKTKRSSRLKAVIFGTLLLIAMAILGYRLAHTMAFFNVRSIEVSGNNIVSRDRVMLYSGIAIGDNIFKVDSREVELNLKSDPYVKSVDVKKSLPSGVHLSIEENKDALVMDLGEKVYLSQDGIVLSKSPEYRGYFVPALEGLSVTEEIVVSNEIQYENDIERGEFNSFLRGLLNSSLHNRLASVVIEGDMATLKLTTGELVAFGQFKDVDYKWRYLEEILGDLEEKAKYFEKIDFTRGNRVIVEEKIFGEED